MWWKEINPIIEGGKWVWISNWETAWNFALNSCVWTISFTNPQIIDENWNEIRRYEYKSRIRTERYNELVKQSIQWAISQVKYANNIAWKEGIINANSLWKAWWTKTILVETLEALKKDWIRLDGITTGAGMPYEIWEIASTYDKYYYPIISSTRAFKILYKKWKFENTKKNLWWVVYECPWTAWWHNGITNAENPNEPQKPYERLKVLRTFMNSVKLENVPIILAWWVWNIKDYDEYLDNPEIWKIAFQFWSRPMLTQEYLTNNIEWRNKLVQIKKWDISLNEFSPTWFFSSACKNDFLKELEHRTESEIEYRKEQVEEETTTKNKEKITKIFNTKVEIWKHKSLIYIQEEDLEKFKQLKNAWYTEELKSPSNTIISVTKEVADEIAKNKIECMWCLAWCKFSGWVEDPEHRWKIRPDPRSFCIQKTLQNSSHWADINNELMFAWSESWRFWEDPLYQNWCIPTIKELVETIMAWK
jgi:nitronate monooxygenase